MDYDKYETKKIVHENCTILKREYAGPPAVIDWYSQENETAHGSRQYETRYLLFCPRCGERTDFGKRAVTELYHSSEGKKRIRKNLKCRKCGKMVPVSRHDARLPAYVATDNARNPLKLWAFRWLGTTLFNEEDGSVSMLMDYMVPFVNRNGDEPVMVSLYGSVRVRMNMKTGQTYAMNAKIYGKYASNIIRVFSDNNPHNITYGNGSGAFYAFDGRMAGRLNNPQIIKYFAEEMVRYGRVKKEMLTMTGDYSDTTFTRLCLCNNSPYYRYGFYGELEKLARCDGWKAYIGKMKKVSLNGQDYAAAYFMKGAPKSIRKLIAEKPFTFYAYDRMKKAGFKNPDIIRTTLTGIPTEKVMNIAEALKLVRRKEPVPGRPLPPADTRSFIMEYREKYGEKNAVKILLEKYNLLYDTARMYYSLPEKERKMESSDISQIHDSVGSLYAIKNRINAVYEYDSRQLQFEDTVDGVDFLLPKSTRDLFAAKQELSNCVASYETRILQMDCIVVVMHRKNRRIGCIEICRNTVRQGLGPRNSPFGGTEEKTFQKWRKRHGLKDERSVRGGFQDDDDDLLPFR